jgi:hypothetical protein
MSDTKTVIDAGHDIVTGATGRLRLVVLVSPGVIVAMVNFVEAYHKRSISDAIVAGLLWLVLYPFLALRYSPKLYSPRPK